MPKQDSSSICLAMIVRDEAPTIERCLLAAKPFISHWVIIDTGSSDDTMGRIHCTMQGIQGQLQERPLDDYSSLRNELLNIAAKTADLILMLDADEELQTLHHALTLPAQWDIGLLSITHERHTIRCPRLFRSSAIPQYRFRAGEQPVLTDQTTGVLQGFQIRHHCDGIRFREANDPIANQFLIESVVAGESDDPQRLLTLAKLELNNNQPGISLRHLNTIIELFPSSPENWQASYLAANILLSQNQTADAIELLQQCVESSPERAEPLMRLAELHFESGDYRRAQDLSRLIIGLPEPTEADYLEPAVYQYEGLLLMAESAAKTNDAQALEHAMLALAEQSKLPESVTSRMQTLRSTTTEAPKTKTRKNKTPARETPRTNPSTGNTKNSAQPKLTIGMATHDDFDGVYFSIVSLVLYHGELLDQVEILVVDNNPDSKHGDAVRGLCKRVPRTRYVAAGEYQGTAIRELIFAEARGTHVLCMDCHVFLHQGVVAALLNYFTDHPNNPDLLHGPLFYDNLDHFSTHMTADWNAGFYGRWATDSRGREVDGEPFEIPLQGMGLFACTKAHWPGFNQKFRGFGGEEGYIHEKFRQRGGRVLCLPFLRWTHRFERPNSPSYPNLWADRVRNYLIGWHELGLDRNPILDHFTNHLDYASTASINARFLLELESPFWSFDTIYLIDDSHNQEYRERVLRALALEKICQVIKNPSEMGRLLEMATIRGLDNVVLIDGRDKQLDNLLDHLQNAQAQLRASQADIVIQGNAANLAATQLIIFQPNSYTVASRCFIRHGECSAERIHDIDASIVVTSGFITPEPE